MHQKVSSDDQIKSAQELPPNPYVQSLPCLLFEEDNVLTSFCEKLKDLSYCSVLNMRSGILPASQSLPDVTLSAELAFPLALLRIRREDWLLSNRDIEQQKKHGMFPLALNF